MKKITRIVAALIVLAMLAGCGEVVEKIKETAGDAEARLTEVTITFPKPTEAEAIMNSAATVAVETYLAARAKLDEFLATDVESLNLAKFAIYKQGLAEAIEDFEIAEKLAGVLDEAAEVWLNASGDKAPEYTTRSAKSGARSDSLVTRVYADDDSPAVKWAKDITERFDKAPAGKGIRTLAAQMGTDAKHAYAQLKQAQAILEGAEWTDIADTANKAYQTAKALKTAGTGAGFVIACAAAAPAAGVVGAAIKTGSIVTSGANYLLEIGETSCIVAADGEDTDASIAFAKTQKQFAPVGTVFAVAKAGLAVKDIVKLGGKIASDGYGSLTADEANALGTKTFVALSFVTSQITSYTQSGNILGGTLKQTEKGLEISLIDTLVGGNGKYSFPLSAVSDPANSELLNKVLPDGDPTVKDDGDKKPGIANLGENIAGVGAKENEKSTESAEPTEPTEPGDVPTVSSEDDIGPESALPSGVCKDILNDFKDLKDDGFDVDDYINKLRQTLMEIAEMGEVMATDTSPDDTEPPADDTETETETETAAPDPDGGLPSSLEGIEDFLGSWQTEDDGKVFYIDLRLSLGYDRIHMSAYEPDDDGEDEARERNSAFVSVPFTYRGETLELTTTEDMYTRFVSDGVTLTKTGDPHEIKLQTFDGTARFTLTRRGTGRSHDKWKWVDPYEYFKVKTADELYEKLESAECIAFRVSPIGYDYWDYFVVPMENDGTFEIGIVRGDETEYETRYRSGDDYEVKLKLIADPDEDSLFRVESEWKRYKAGTKTLVDSDTDDDALTFVCRDIDGEPEFALKGSCVDPGSDTVITFVIEEICIPAD